MNDSYGQRKESHYKAMRKAEKRAKSGRVRADILALTIWGSELGGCRKGINCVDPGFQMPKPKESPFPKQQPLRGPAQWPYTPRIYRRPKKAEPPSGPAGGGNRHRFSDYP